MKVLFVCVGNTCRSQMAEAICKSLGHSADSAGTHPGSEVNPNAIIALEEKGIESAGLVLLIFTPTKLNIASSKSFLDPYLLKEYSSKVPEFIKLPIC